MNLREDAINHALQTLIFQMRINMRITNEDFDVSESIDLEQKKFFKKALKTYKKLSLLKKEDGSDLSAYKLFLRNLEMNRKDYGSVTTSDIYKEFVHLKDVNNVRRVLELETRIFDQKIRLVPTFNNFLIPTVFFQNIHQWNIRHAI